MIERTAISPVGETIQLVGDVEWAKKAGVTEKGIRMWNAGNKRFIIAALWEHGPFLDEKSGRATKMLADYCMENYGMSNPTSITGLLSDPLNAPAFERSTNGKRTYAIKLKALPNLWFEKLTDTLTTEIAAVRASKLPPAPDPVDDVVVVSGYMDAPQADVATPSDAEWRDITASLELDAPTTYEIDGPPIELEIAASVAMQLLTQVVEIIHAGSPEQTDARVRKLTMDIAEVQSNLGKRLEENQTLRRQLRDLGDELKAVRFERDGLRTRLRTTESNLKAALNGDASKAVTQEVAKRIDQFMRAAPTSKKGDDEK